MRPQFTLTVVTSADGFIARHREDPRDWVSARNGTLFRADVEAADWTIVGRGTHEMNDRPNRRRIVFSTGAASREWRRASQLWIDPNGLAPEDLAAAVEAVRPMKHALIAGGARVYDWFRKHGAIDRVHLTIEPVRFGVGLPIFTDQSAGDPLSIFSRAGYEPVYDRPIDDAGTRFLVLEPERATLG